MKKATLLVGAFLCTICSFAQVNTTVKYFTAPELRAEAEANGMALIAINNVTTTGNKYINGLQTGDKVSESGTLADAREPYDNEVLEMIPADGGYILRQAVAEEGEGYIGLNGNNFTVTVAGDATVWTVLGPGEEGYGNVSGYDDIYTDIDKSLNDNMVRFIVNGNQYMNGQGYGNLGGVRGGTGAWSFNYIYNANYGKVIEPVVPEDAYPVNFDKETNLTYNREDRPTTSVSITVGGEMQSIVVEDQSVVYRDLSEQKFTVNPGATVKPGIGYGGEWMHGYLYLDTNCNYYFDVAEDFMDENDELVSFTFYSPTDSSTGLNSAGETKSNNCNAKDLPAFTAPEKPGEYRMRYIVDWNCVDPGGQYGSNYSSNYINANKGCIIDVTLVVEEGGTDPVVDVNREAFEPWKDQINGEFAEIAYAYGYQVPTEDVAGKKPAEVAAPVVQYWLDRTGIVQIGLPYETVVEVLASYYQTTVAADYELGQQLLAAYHAAEDVAEAADYSAELAEAVEAANAALEGAYNEYVTAVGENLITRNDQFASPYTETREGSINNLIDGDQGSYWHSSWAYSVPAHTHYLQVKLDEAISGDVMATISRRLNVANDHVVLMGVEASLDGNNYVTVGQLEFPYTGTPATQSATFNLAEEAKYLRFYNDQSNGSYQRGYWHISEFQLNQTCTVRDLDAPAYAYPTAVADLEAAIAAAQKLEKPSEADVEALNNAIAAYRAAIAEYPEFTEWTGDVEVVAGEVNSIDDLLNVDLKFNRALDVEESGFSVLGAVIDPSGDGYAIAFGDLFGNVEINKVKSADFVGNVASVEFMKLSDLDADLRAEAKKTIAKIGGFAAAEGEAYVLFASKSFLVDGEKYNEFVKAGYDLATGTLTGIETITIPASELTFDLQGRRANNAVKGMYIVGGKKVIK